MGVYRCTCFADEDIEAEILRPYPLTLKSPAGFTVEPLPTGLHAGKVDVDEERHWGPLCSSVQSALAPVVSLTPGLLFTPRFRREASSRSPWIHLTCVRTSWPLLSSSMLFCLLPSFQRAFPHRTGGKMKTTVPKWIQFFGLIFRQRCTRTVFWREEPQRPQFPKEPRTDQNQEPL